MSGAFARLRGLLITHPYSANAALASAMMLGGDGAAQAAERRARGGGGRYDAQRAGVAVTWSIIQALFWKRWYDTLLHRLPGRYLVWVVATACLPAPVMNAGFFSFTTAAAELLRAPRPPAADIGAAVADKLRERWPAAVIVSTQMWTVVNYINFLVIPHEFRVVFGGAAALIWNTYLSSQNGRAHGSTGAPSVPLLWSPEVEWRRGAWPRIVTPPGGDALR